MSRQALPLPSTVPDLRGQVVHIHVPAAQPPPAFLQQIVGVQSRGRTKRCLSEASQWEEMFVHRLPEVERDTRDANCDVIRPTGKTEARRKGGLG